MWRILLVVLILTTYVDVTFAQDDWTCDGGEKDILAAAQAAFDEGDYETADELALLTQTLCGANLSYFNKAAQLHTKIQRLSAPTATPAPTVNPVGKEAFDLLSEGRELVKVGSYEEAEAKFDEALSLFISIEDVTGQIWVYQEMVALYLAMDDFEAEMETYTVWIALLRAHIDEKELDWIPQRLATALKQQGDSYQAHGDYADAIDVYLLAIEEYATFTWRQTDIAPIHLEIAYSYAAWDRPEKAIEYFTLAEAYYASFNTLQEPDVFNAFNVQIGLGEAYQDIGDYEKAQTHFQNAYDMMVGLFPFGRMVALDRLGDLAFEQRDFTTAEDYYMQGLMTFARLDEPTDRDATWQANLLFSLAHLSYFREDVEQAEAYTHEILDLAEDFNISYEKMTALYNLGFYAFQRDDFAIAQDYFEQALEIAERTDDEEFITDILEYLDKIEAETGSLLPQPDLASLSIPELPFPTNPDPKECGIPTMWGKANNQAWLTGMYEGELVEPIVYLYESHLRTQIIAAAPHGTQVEIVMFQGNPVLDFYYVHIPNAPVGQNMGWVPAPFLAHEPVK